MLNLFAICCHSKTCFLRRPFKELRTYLLKFSTLKWVHHKNPEKLRTEQSYSDLIIKLKCHIVSTERTFEHTGGLQLIHGRKRINCWTCYYTVLFNSYPFSCNFNIFFTNKFFLNHHPLASSVGRSKKNENTLRFNKTAWRYYVFRCSH